MSIRRTTAGSFNNQQSGNQQLFPMVAAAKAGWFGLDTAEELCGV